MKHLVANRVPSKKLPEYSVGGLTRAASSPTTDFMVDSRAALPYYNRTTQSVTQVSGYIIEV